MVTDEVQINPRSFVSTPCEHVYVTPKELYQLFLLFGGKSGSNLEELLWVVADNNFL